MSRKCQEATNSSEQLKFILCWDLVCKSYCLYIGRFAVVACEYGSLETLLIISLNAAKTLGKWYHCITSSHITRLGPIPNITIHVQLWSWLADLQWPLHSCVCLVHENIGCPIHQLSEECLRASTLRPLCTLDVHFCWACTEASSSANFYLTVRVALRHESVDSEEERDGLGCHLGQGLGCDIADMYVCEC